MTEVLFSKHYGHDAPEMDFSPRQSTSANGDSDEVLGSPSSLLNLRSPVVSPLVDETSGRRESTSTTDQDCSFLGGDFEQTTRQERDSIVESDQDRAQLSILALLLAAFKRSGFTCQAPQEEIKMDISWPTDVRHVTHVTFDRFNGFLGLPLELQLEMPRRVPSASASVFGVSAESMQCLYDRKGNSVPTILLLLQERLYDQGGLRAEGIFRINAENSREEFVRDQLNRGIVPSDIDVHCLAGLIKAWFRELPKGVLDSLSPEQVMQCHTEEQCLELVKMLPTTQAALLDWAVNLMTDVVQEEELNKMNARNIAMVFAPNMTQMSDPLTALMHAVQVMNFLKNLILKTLRDRQDAVLDPGPSASCFEPPNGDNDGNAKKGPLLGVNGKRNNCEENDSTRQMLYSEGFNSEQRMGENGCSEDLNGAFLSGFSGRETTDEDEISNGSQGPFSNGSSTMYNMDDDSNGLEDITSNTYKTRSACHVHTTKRYINGIGRAGKSAGSLALGNSKTKFPVYGSRMKGRTEPSKVDNSNRDTTDFVHRDVLGSLPSTGKNKGRLAGKPSKVNNSNSAITDFAHHGVLDPLPGTGKNKEGRLVGKIDQQSERVEAW